MSYCISFVVDALKLHYYQAELLLYSLEQNSSFNKEDIIVQCTSKVENCFFDFLNANNYHYTIIEPYLDAKYCNKLQQLNYFLDKDCKGVFLLDTDMYILGDFTRDVGEKIAAKVVDAPNPPLSVLQRIYHKACMAEPPIVHSDWEFPANETFYANCNGGFYFIPKNYIESFNTQWREQATWLYENRDLFDNEAQSIHVDQVSFSMALNSANFPFEYLDANCNYPTHVVSVPNSLRADKEVYLLHYHRMLNDFGYLDDSQTTNTIVLQAIETANTQIAQKKDVYFFEDLKRSQSKFTKTLHHTSSTQERLKLFLHCGTPKTGTTSLQHFLYKNQAMLIENGILYPDLVNGMNPPKHQWIVSCLMSGDVEQFFRYIQEVLKLVKEHQCNTVILSTEGIYNHWWDFSSNATEMFEILNEHFEVSPVICFREPASFLKSYYVQNLKNPQNNAAQCYGKDLSLQEMLTDRWFVKHLDYVGFIADLEAVFTEGNIHIIKHSARFIEDFCKLLNLEISLEGFKNENLGFSGIASEFLRVINRYNVEHIAKQEIVKELQVFDQTLKKHISSELIDEKLKEQINHIFYLQRLSLKKLYGLDF